MFGYIKPFKPQLRVCEFDTYKAVYCGLCKQLSSSYGPFARFTLSYDFTFLALLDMALREDEHPTFSSERCPYNPLKKSMCCKSCDTLQFSASCAMLMVYYKVLDNISDEKFFKRVFYRMVLPIAKRARNKACKLGFFEADKYICAQMKNQAELEQNNCGSVDMAGEPTANCLSFLFEMLTENEGDRRILSRFGYLLGRLIYLMDALDDLEEDEKNGSYNPFLVRAGAGESITELKNEAVLSLNLTIGEIGKTFDLLKLFRYEGILENIVYMGLKSTTENVCEKRQEKTAEQHGEGEQQQ